MAENSKIEWTDHTFNGVIGCTKVTPECTNCYAKEQQDDRYGRAKWGPNGTRHVTSPANWLQVMKWQREAAKAGRRDRVFAYSLADVFEDNMPAGHVDLDTVREWLWALIEATPNLIWLLLTKRPQNIRAMVPAAWLEKWPENVRTGTSAGCQDTADELVPHLLQVPGPHFLSCEPMLGPVDIRERLVQRKTTHMSVSVEGAIRNRAYGMFTDEDGKSLSKRAAESELLALHAKGVKLIPMGKCPTHDPVSGCPGHAQPRIDWVICGGESGPNARPMHPHWARGLRDQCVEAGVPFFFKQWGEWAPETIEGVDPDLQKLARNQYVAVGDGSTNHIRFTRVGKKDAGRQLDGRTWDELPKGLGGNRE